MTNRKIVVVKKAIYIGKTEREMELKLAITIAKWKAP
jgi:hypothetical protein